MARHGQEDFNYRRAKQEGFAARSVYKLKELDTRYGLLRPGCKVLDLGCHPGSWLQYSAERVGAKGAVVGVDIQPLELALPGQVSFYQADLLTVTSEQLPRLNYDVVLSDVAPRTTGIAHADAARSAELTGVAFSLAASLLKPGGSFVGKIFWGPEAEALLRSMRPAFRQAKAHKPAASTASSREIYLLGLSLK